MIQTGHQLWEIIVADLFFCFVVVAMAYDLLKLRIPNLLPAGLAALFLVGAPMASPPVDWIGHIGGGMLVLLLASILFGFRLIGGGDAKLLAAISLWIGLPLLPAYFLALGVAGGLLALALILARPTLERTEPLWCRMGASMPRAFRPGEGVPYGIAIGAAALMVSSSIPLLASLQSHQY